MFFSLYSAYSPFVFKMWRSKLSLSVDIARSTVQVTTQLAWHAAYFYLCICVDQRLSQI